ncbi:MAG: metallophosphoesterase [Clostridia bacterium]|nr:metallophosphoesterase [Clostridia bacterium]
MSIFAISDLHLSFGANKPMDIFRGWDNHTERLLANWNRLVGLNDTVVIPGDLSWSLKLEDTEKDFEFLKKLNGKKILLKGNHDLWWSTATKIQKFFAEKEITDTEIIFNNTVITEGYAIAGTRGWFYDSSGSQKVLLREAGRLEASIKAALDTGHQILVFLHYPPVYGEYVCREILDILKKYNINEVYHGHIHGSGFNQAVNEFEGIKFHLISCDCIDFTPFKIT